MKFSNISKFSFVLILALLLSFYSVKSQTVTQPILEYSNLMRGDSTRFFFEIQALGYPNKQTCTFSANGLDPLIITFDEDQALINPGEIKNVYGTVSIPDDAPMQSYSGSLGVSCTPEAEFKGSGSAVKITYTVNFPVNVVSEVEETPPQPIPEKPMPAPPYLTIFIIIIIIIIALILVIGVYYWRNRKKE